MVSLFKQRRDEPPYSFDARAGRGAAVVEAENGAVPGGGGQPGDDSRCGELPISSDGGPHHAQKTELALRRAQAEPAGSVRRAEQGGGNAGGLDDRSLRPGQFVVDGMAGTEVQAGVGVAMIADFVARRGDLTHDIRQAPHVHAALEEGGAGAVALEQAEQLGSRFAWPVVESEGDGSAVGST